MNIDAVVVANYFYKLPSDVYDALETILRYGGDCDPDHSLLLANHINDIPSHVLSALNRILEI